MQFKFKPLEIVAKSTFLFTEDNNNNGPVEHNNNASENASDNGLVDHINEASVTAIQSMAELLIGFACGHNFVDYSVATNDFCQRQKNLIRNNTNLKVMKRVTVGWV